MMRRQRKQSSPKPEQAKSNPDGNNREPSQQEPKKESIELPDAFCRYLTLKYPDTWQKFIEFAKTKKTFATGLARLLDILRTGDEQDKKIFGLFPLDVLGEFDIELEIDGCKEEYEKSTTIVLGGNKWPWRKVINECRWNKDPSIQGLLKFSDIDKMPNGPEREAALENKRHIENNALVRKALEIFGGQIVGFKNQDEGDGE